MMVRVTSVDPDNKILYEEIRELPIELSAPDCEYWRVEVVEE